MQVTVRRKSGVDKILRFSLGNLPSLSFPEEQDVFEVPLALVASISDYFDISFEPLLKEPKIVLRGDKE